MEGLTPEGYEALTGVAPADYERRLLAAARVEAARGGFGDAAVEVVTLEGEADGADLVVVLRHPGRPAARYGWRMPVWPAPPPDDPVLGTPELRGSYRLTIELEEVVEAAPGLPPPDPDADGLTWIRP